MSAVNLWKPHKLQSRTHFADLNGKWRFVRILENRALLACPPRISEFWSTSINIFSASFSNLLHRARIQDQKAQRATIAEGKRGTLAGGAARVSEYGAENRCGLLQRVHQPRDRAVQVFVRPPQLFDFVDRMQHRGMVLAAELPADLRKRSG